MADLRAATDGHVETRDSERVLQAPRAVAKQEATRRKGKLASYSLTFTRGGFVLEALYVEKTKKHKPKKKYKQRRE